MGRLQRTADRDDFLAAHLLVRSCVATLLGRPDVPITIVQHCAACGGPHGRPEVMGHPDVYASLAHSRGVVAAAAAFGPVGVDVEALPAAPGLRTADFGAVLAPAEATAIDRAPDPAIALLRQWVRKEAFLKTGAVDLEGLPALDLSRLPLLEPAAAMTARAEPLGAWVIHDWADDRSPAVGAVVAGPGSAVSLVRAGCGNLTRRS